jgi:HSP90 family molecular chaperone
MTQSNIGAGTQVGLTVNLAGIIKIFGSSLYNEFGAIVRELVQNGHDTALEAFAARRGEDRPLSDYWVNVRYDSVARVLVLADNGMGMDRADISTDLNDFGRPKKTDVRAEVTTLSPDQPLYIIGLYGVGFLSALAVSESVEVWSRTRGGMPVLWTYQSGQEFATVRDVSAEQFSELHRRHGIRSDDVDASGTIVICRLSTEAEDEYRVSPDVVRESLLRYARLLRIPVFFNSERITLRSIAWDNPARATERDWKEMIEETTGSTPLFIIPVYSSPAELDLEGVLWIPERRTILGDSGHIDVYIRRMFVMQDERLLRPQWARFIMGMVNANKLGRIVSGNTIINDRHADAVREFVDGKIIAAFDTLWKLPEEEYWRIIGEHDDVIKIAAAEHEQFLDCVWDKLRVRTRGRAVTLPEYLDDVRRRTDRADVIYYYDKPGQEFAAGVVSDTTSIPVLSLWSLNDDAFVRRVAKRRKFELLSYTELAASVIKKPQDESKFRSLIVACASQKIAADVREYEPAHMPAMLIEDDVLEQRRSRLTEILRESGDSVDARIAAELQSTFLRGGAINRDVSFYLNASNSLVQELTKAPFETQQAICLALYNVSYMSSMPQIGRAEVQAIYSSICTVLTKLLEQSKPPAPLPPEEVACRPTRLFMITPYAESYRRVEDAVREVFESPPYFFQVVLARDFMHESHLLEDIRAHINAADGFVADITGLNPNVMLELGAVLVNRDRGRPVLLLRGNTDERMPANIAGQLAVSYEAASDSTAQIAGRVRAMVEPNGQPTHRDIVALLQRQTCKALTKRLLALTRCNDSEQRRILEHYATVEQLLEVTSEVVFRTTGISPVVAEFIQKQLREQLPSPPRGPSLNVERSQSDTAGASS